MYVYFVLKYIPLHKNIKSFNILTANISPESLPYGFSIFLTDASELSKLLFESHSDTAMWCPMKSVK